MKAIFYILCIGAAAVLFPMMLEEDRRYAEHQAELEAAKTPTERSYDKNKQVIELAIKLAYQRYDIPFAYDGDYEEVEVIEDTYEVEFSVQNKKTGAKTTLTCVADRSSAFTISVSDVKVEGVKNKVERKLDEAAADLERKLKYGF